MTLMQFVTVVGIAAICAIGVYLIWKSLKK